MEENMKKRWLSLLLSATVAVTMAAGCGTEKNEGNTQENNTAEEGTGTDNAGTEDNNQGNNETADAQGAVYYLNFKPEQAEQWKELAKLYSDETGVPVTIETAASGTYESSLKSEMAKSEAPTLFQVNGPARHASCKD